MLYREAKVESVEYSETIDIVAVCPPRVLGQIGDYTPDWTPPKEDWNDTLKTRRLLLAPWREEDAEALYALASDPEIGPHVRLGTPRKRGGKPGGHPGCVQSRREVCAILSRESGALLGAVGLQPSSEIFPELSATEQREMGYWLGRPYWGHGVMTEAATELLRLRL